MISINKLQVGQVVYDVHSYRMGNTTMRSIGVWPVRIAEINLAENWVMASWNGNPPKKYRGPKLKWFKEKPLLVAGICGSHRRPTPEERKKMKEALK